MIEAKWIWMDGQLVRWQEAQVHVLTHSLHYGCAVFEGIRCYDTGVGPAVFRLREHMERLRGSGHIVGMKIPWTVEQLETATLTLIRRNEQTACYVRPLAFYGYGIMGLNPTGSTVSTTIATWPWGAYLGEDGVRNGIRVKVSTFTRHHPNVTMTKAKVAGNYVNSTLAKLEAVRDGYTEALLLDSQGFVVEGSGENLFVVEKGRLITPPLSSCLDGITRETVTTLAAAEGLSVMEDHVTRDRLYVADEVFLTGTAAEITPVREIDGRQVGPGTPGPVTRTLQSRYRAATRGEDPDHLDWLTPVTEQAEALG